MKIYHGSKLIIQKPIFQGSDPTNDYGSAFYLTLDLSNVLIRTIPINHVANKNIKMKLGVVGIKKSTAFGKMSGLKL